MCHLYTTVLLALMAIWCTIRILENVKCSRRISRVSDIRLNRTNRWVTQILHKNSQFPPNECGLEIDECWREQRDSQAHAHIGIGPLWTILFRSDDFRKFIASWKRPQATKYDANGRHKSIMHLSIDWTFMRVGDLICLMRVTHVCVRICLCLASSPYWQSKWYETKRKRENICYCHRWYSPGLQSETVFRLIRPIVSLLMTHLYASIHMSTVDVGACGENVLRGDSILQNCKITLAMATC